MTCFSNPNFDEMFKIRLVILLLTWILKGSFRHMLDKKRRIECVALVTQILMECPKEGCRPSCFSNLDYEGMLSC